MLTDIDKTIIKAAIKELIGLRKSFTGYDLYRRIHNRKVRGRTLDFTACGASELEVSKYARDCFNYLAPVFKQYGATIIPPGPGADNTPVLYFPLPYHAKHNVQKVWDSMHALNSGP